jgi:hypothetical protein
MSHKTPVSQWMRSLGYLRPYRIILERGSNRRVTIKNTATHGYRGRRPAGLKTVWLSSCLEAKWIKRFRRTILNKKTVGDVSRLLVNPQLPWDDVLRQRATDALIRRLRAGKQLHDGKSNSGMC